MKLKPFEIANMFHLNQILVFSLGCIILLLAFIAIKKTENTYLDSYLLRIIIKDSSQHIQTTVSISSAVTGQNSHKF